MATVRMVGNCILMALGLLAKRHNKGGKNKLKVAYEMGKRGSGCQWTCVVVISD